MTIESNTGNNEGKTVLHERLADEHKERQRLFICERLLLPETTTWEQINELPYKNLIVVLAGEAHMGTTIQDVEVYGQYKTALAALENETKLDATPFFERAVTLLEKYDQTQIEALLTLTTVEEAQSNELRECAKKDNIAIHKFIKSAELFSNINPEALEQLNKKRRVLQNAIGALRDGRCTHDDII